MLRATSDMAQEEDVINMVMITKVILTWVKDLLYEKWKVIEGL